MTGAVVLLVVVLAVAAVVGFLLRDNGSDGAEPVVTRTAPASPTGAVSSPTSVTATTGAAAPVLPAAATKPTRSGAEAFVRYFFDVYNYSYASLGTSAFEDLSLPGCDFCSGVVRNADAARGAGQSVEGGRITVREAVAAPGEPQDGLVVNALIDQEELVTRDDTGSAVNRAEAVQGVRVDARVVWDGTRWKVRAVRVEGTQQ